MTLRGAFHFTGCAVQDRDGVWIRGQFGNFVEALSRRLEHLDLLLDEKTSVAVEGFEGQTDFYVSAPNIGFCALGPYTGRLAALRRFVAIPRNISGRGWDFILIREPARRAPVIRFWSGRTPKVLLLGGDYTTSLQAPRSSLTYWRARFFDAQLRQAMRSALVFVNNEMLLDRWRPFARNILLTRTTTLPRSVVLEQPAPRFQNSQPYRLLYVGRLDPLKGIEDLLRALAILNRDGKRYELLILGSGDPAYEARLRQLAGADGLADAVQFGGYVPPSFLWEHYLKADVFVLPTLAENISRSVWEAMSQGCPVVTTPVGGQGRAFRDRKDLLFFEPGNEQDLCGKIELLRTDERLRRAICARGLELARGNTVEARSAEMVEAIENWLGSRRSQ
ncbi:MAG: glycosyltransferase family 4 protein [Chloroflexi bacterium]|nr:glycosyltransferase family 4 protein [Chloroflexota bacterium]